VAALISAWMLERITCSLCRVVRILTALHQLFTSFESNGTHRKCCSLSLHCAQEWRFEAVKELPSVLMVPLHYISGPLLALSGSRMQVPVRYHINSDSLKLNRLCLNWVWVVGVVTGCALGSRFCLHHCIIQTGLWYSSCPVGTRTRGSFSSVNWPGHEADCSPPSSTEDKNVWSCSSSLQYFSVVLCLIKRTVLSSRFSQRWLWQVLSSRDDAM
jgi:hypothetical protein